MRAVLCFSLALALFACSETDPEPATSTPNTSGFDQAGAGGAAGEQAGGSAGVAPAGAGGAAAGSDHGSAGKSSGKGGSASGGAGSGQGGAQAGAGQAGSGAAGQAGSGQAGSGQAGSGQAGSGQAGSGQAGGGQAGSGGAGAAGAGGDAAGAAGAAGGGVCSLPVNPGEFYALQADSIEQSDAIPMCTYQQKVVLVVNVASMCGYTPQYGPLEKLYKTYSDKGFVILGFPCNQFGSQESGTDQQISQFCTQSYGITFPMFHKIEVNGPNEHPIYQWLKSQPGGAGDIPWNFTKFLLSREGKLLARIPTETSPDDPAVVAQIEAALAQ